MPDGRMFSDEEILPTHVFFRAELIASLSLSQFIFFMVDMYFFLRQKNNKALFSVKLKPEFCRKTDFFFALKYNG